MVVTADTASCPSPEIFALGCTFFSFVVRRTIVNNVSSSKTLRFVVFMVNHKRHIFFVDKNVIYYTICISFIHLRDWQANFQKPFFPFGQSVISRMTLTMMMMTVTSSKTFLQQGVLLVMAAVWLQSWTSEKVAFKLIHPSSRPSKAIADPPTVRIKSAGFEAKWTAIHHASLFCTCYYLIRALYQDLYSCGCRQKLGLTTRWQMICQTRALVIFVTTINWTVY